MFLAHGFFPAGGRASQIMRICYPWSLPVGLEPFSYCLLESSIGTLESSEASMELERCGLEELRSPSIEASFTSLHENG